MFRPDRLEKDLSQPAVQNVLKTFGYTDYKVGASIKHLKQRVEENTCFPHEIGLFLSYPVEDVIQFIRQRAVITNVVGYGRCIVMRHLARRCLHVTENAQKYI